METVTVSIYGETYTLKTGDDPDGARKAAHYVDSKMREIAAGGKVIPTSKVAILAALNIADDLLRQTREDNPEEESTDRRMEKLIIDLHKVLET